jgi:hypothetical protein
LFAVTTAYGMYRLYDGEWDGSMIMNCTCLGFKVSTTVAFDCGDLRKPRKIAVRIEFNPAQIRIGYVSIIISLSRYYYTIPLLYIFYSSIRATFQTHHSLHFTVVTTSDDVYKSRSSLLCNVTSWSAHLFNLSPFELSQQQQMWLILLKFINMKSFPDHRNTHSLQPKCPDRLWGSLSLLSNGYRGLFP